MSDLSNLKEVIGDYRYDDGIIISEDHIQKWLRQFPEDDRHVLVNELTYTLDKTYWSKTRVCDFLEKILSSTKRRFVGDNPEEFWRNVNILNIQQQGSSQQEMIHLLDLAAKRKYGFGVTAKPNSTTHVYLDDALYSGNRIHRDFKNWLEAKKEDSGEVHVVVLASHKQGKFYASEMISDYQKKFNTRFNFHWWSFLKFENRSSYLSHSDVLKTTKLPDDPMVSNLVNKIEKRSTYSIKMRPITNPPYISQFFSNERGRQELERIFLVAGTRVLDACPDFPEFINPYGFSFLRGLGFGSLLAFYRNCPNTSPLSLWAGNPWIPLFPRKTN